MKAKILSIFALIWSKIKVAAGKVREKFLKIFPKREPKYFDASKHEWKYMRNMAIVAFLLNLYIEEFARLTTSPVAGILFMVQHPVIFFYNVLVIFATFTLSLLFKKRKFVWTVIGLVWFGLGTANGVILIFRMTPLTLYDIKEVGDAITLLHTYVAKWEITAGTIAIAILLVALVFIFFRSTKWINIKYGREIAIIAVSVAVAFGATLGLIKLGALSTFFGNLNYAYRDYGFGYCFINTAANTGIRKPSDYSEETIDTILEEDTTKGLNTTLKKTNDSTDHPNIIVLQLESFTTADKYKNISVDKDPTPVFNKLKKEYTSGTFKVPACGAGTANTEFEVLTGISSKFFGPGEYPYKAKLRKKTLESMAYVLDANGYNTAALHDHRAVFYNRNEVYANLGFNSFTSLEYMNGIEKNPTGWCKDKVLTSNIMEIMKSTKSRDFLHVISVEGHGKYPDTQLVKNPYTTVTADDEETKWKYEYYLNDCHEMDTFLGNLIKAINKADEPTIMIIYGDHIPALDVKESNYKGGNLYKTDYVIWDNIGLEKQDQNITSYEAGAILLQKAGLAHQGVIFDYQQTTKSTGTEFRHKLKELSYDILYGDYYSFGGVNPFKKTNMTMGHKKIKIKDIVKIGNKYYIEGENFTEHSSVSLDGKVLSTVYLNPSLLGLKEEVDESDVSKLQVSQIDTKDNSILSTINSLEEL